MKLKGGNKHLISIEENIWRSDQSPPEIKLRKLKNNNRKYNIKLRKLHKHINKKIDVSLKHADKSYNQVSQTSSSSDSSPASSSAMSRSRCFSERIHNLIVRQNSILRAFRPARLYDTTPRPEENNRSDAALVAAIGKNSGTSLKRCGNLCAPTRAHHCSGLSPSLANVVDMYAFSSSHGVRVSWVTDCVGPAKNVCVNNKYKDRLMIME